MSLSQSSLEMQQAVPRYFSKAFRPTAFCVNSRSASTSMAKHAHTPRIIQRPFPLIERRVLIFGDLLFPSSTIVLFGDWENQVIVFQALHFFLILNELHTANQRILLNKFATTCYCILHPCRVRSRIKRKNLKGLLGNVFEKICIH